jgi:hypothetical protein
LKLVHPSFFIASETAWWSLVIPHQPTCQEVAQQAQFSEAKIVHFQFSMIGRWLASLNSAEILHSAPNPEVKAM